MNKEENDLLQKMIEENQTPDNTNYIRLAKNSKIIRNEINILLENIKKYEPDLDKINEESMDACPFLFANLYSLYTKIRKSTINLNILNKLLDILEDIENGKYNQQEGSYQVGLYLKEIFIDSDFKILAERDKVNQNNDNQPNLTQPASKITWKEFKYLYCKEIKIEEDEAY